MMLKANRWRGRNSENRARSTCDRVPVVRQATPFPFLRFKYSHVAKPGLAPNLQGASPGFSPNASCRVEHLALHHLAASAKYSAVARKFSATSSMFPPLARS